MTSEQKVLIDTSAWIEALRKNGREDIRERVRECLLAGTAAWNDMIVLELWNGARGEYEKAQLALLEQEVTCLPTTSEVWSLAKNLSRKCRSAGHTVPSADLLIAASGLFHAAAIEHCDSHIATIVSFYSAETGAGTMGRP